jgi:hypothetical protein
MNPKWEKLDDLKPVEAFATHRIAFFRDESDSYEIAIDPLGVALEATVTTKEVMAILPRGSSWSQAVGWRSIVGTWITAAGAELLFIGVISIEPHAERGAFPTVYGYMGCKPSPSLRRALESCASNVSSRPSRAVPDRGVFWCDSRTPEIHRGIEAGVLHLAASRYTTPNRFQFRTLVLCDDDVPRKISSRDFLVVTIPIIHDCFGWSARKWLQANRPIGGN